MTDPFTAIVISNPLPVASDEPEPPVLSTTDMLNAPNLRQIKMAHKLLQQVKSVSLLPKLTTKKFFSGTELERIGQDENCQSILRKNLYYLADQLVNVNNVLSKLVEVGVLTNKEREVIVGYEQEQLIRLAIVISLTKKEAAELGKLMGILKATDNGSLVTLLEGSYIDFETPAYESTDLPAAAALTSMEPVVTSTCAHQQVEPSTPKILGTAAAMNVTIETAEEDDQQPWACTNCTYINASSKLVCGMCWKSKDYRTLDENTCLECPKCTFINEVGKTSCDVCNFQIVPDKHDDDEVDVGQAGEGEMSDSEIEVHVPRYRPSIIRGNSETDEDDLW